MGVAVQLSGESAVFPFRIADRDLIGLAVATAGDMSVNTLAVLDGQAPQTPISAKVTLSAQPLHRNGAGDGRPANLSIPGTAPISGLRIDEYGVRATLNAPGNTPGLYVKDVTYGGRSVLYEPMRVGSGAGNAELQVIVGQDGGTISASVTDKDGNPAADAHVLIMPTRIVSDADLAARIVPGVTDQQGQYQSRLLAPGQYYMVATDDSMDDSPEGIGKLWRAHNKFQEVELAPSGSMAVSLKMMKIE